MNNLIILAVFALYLVILLGLGYLADLKFSKKFEDFIAGGKKFGAIIAAISAGASAESAWVMLGLSGYGYLHGIRAFWAALGCLLGYFLNATLIAKKLRKESGQLGSYTLTEFIADKAGDKGFLVRGVASLIILIFFTSYVVAQFIGSGKTMDSMGIASYKVGVLVGGIIVGLYVLLGGYASVCWSDVLQGFLMMAIFIILPIFGILKAGGIKQIAQLLQGTSLGNPWKNPAGDIAFGFIIGELGISLGYIGMPHYVVRFINIKSVKEAKKAALIAYSWGFFTFFGSVALGIIARALLPGLTDPEQALPTFIRVYTHPVLAGIALSAITAAIMSTADSQLMYAATAFVNDLYKKVLEKSKIKVTDRELILLIRYLISAIAIFAVILALLKVQFIYRYVLDYAWCALGASFGSALILALYHKKFNKWSAFTSLLLGACLTYLWNLLSLQKYIKVYNLVPIFFITLLIGWLVGEITHSPSSTSDIPK
ncbi:MAG: sodium/proline symporter [candidate division WOR-3 bacterium]